MDAGNYQLIAMAGLALTGLTANEYFASKKREFIRKANEVYIPSLKNLDKKVTHLFDEVNRALEARV